MTNLPFNTYQDAKEFFGVQIPKKFFDTLIRIDKFSQTNGYNTLDVLFDVFGILRIEGNEARYQQTPIELFPFGSIGSNGTHYGFVIHTIDDGEHEDNPSGEICPMDSDGVVVIGNNSNDLFQNLITDPIMIEKYSTLLEELKLKPLIVEKKIYDLDGNCFRIKVNPRLGWKFVDTSDGVGVFAEERYFNASHELYPYGVNRSKTIERFETLATDMGEKGFYASQLFYLKELYWGEWTNYELAKKYIGQMLLPYKKLGRQHLYDAAKNVLDTFDTRFRS